MKKYVLSFGLVIAFAFYALLSSNPGSTSIAANQPAVTTPTKPFDAVSNAQTLSLPQPRTPHNAASQTSVKNSVQIVTKTSNNSDDGENDDGQVAIQTAPAPAPSDNTASASGQTPTPTTTAPAPAPIPAPAPAPVKIDTGMYKDGSYAGPVTDAYYGNVQVQAVIQNGKLADVQFLQYPSDRSTSVRINSAAMPQLTQEAIQAQSANVNIVSGATATSQAFVQSLAAALAIAK